jgi:2-C-methyl-D-erythritol 4-phosphate cytidylyltransferase
MAVDLAAIVPLPARYIDNVAAAVDRLAGEAPLARVVRTMRGTAVVAVAEPLVGAVRESLAAHGLSAVGVAVAVDPGSRAQCLAAGLDYLNSRHPSTARVGQRPGQGDCGAAGRQPRRDACACGDRQRESR